MLRITQFNIKKFYNDEKKRITIFFYYFFYYLLTDRGCTIRFIQLVRKF